MTPCPSENVIVDFVEGRLDEAARTTLHDHIAECSACRETLAHLAPPEGELASLEAASNAALDPAAAAGGGEAERLSLPALGPVPGAVVGGRYRLERLLGNGGMGAVWAATHLVTRRKVALKVLRALGGVRPDERGRVLREARAASAVEHPNVVRVLDVFEADGTPVLVMDLLAGESLAQRLERAGRLPLAEVASLLRPVISAVAAAHRAGVVHRDLKPANIFLAKGPGDEPDLRVLDFGVAKLLERPENNDALSASLTRTGEIVGTPFYMSPEQFYGDPDIDPRADVWALGVVLYECLVGRRPFIGTNFGQILKRVLAADFTPLAEAAPYLPRDVTALVERMLSPDRARRPALDAVAAVLDRYAGGTLAATPSRRALGLAAAALVVAASSGAAVFGHRARASLAPTASGALAPSDAPRPSSDAAPSTTPESALAPGDPDGAEGTWRLRAHNTPLTLRVERGQGPLRGTLINEDGGSEPLTGLTWEAPTRTLTFFRSVHRQAFRARVADGILVGRFAEPPRGTSNGAWEPSWPAGYAYHVSGWNEHVLDRAAAPRVWELTLNDDELARLRLDRTPDGRPIGRMKIYHSRSRGADGEQPERDVDVTRWDDAALEFVAHGADRSWRFVGARSGPLLEGTFFSEAGRALPWAGTRAEVLSHGLAPRTAAERDAWQERTRRRLAHLVMAGNPAPLSRDVVALGERPPVEGKRFVARDDAPPEQAGYRLQELEFSWTLPGPDGTPPLHRKAHAFLALPAAADGQRHPVAIALNGHGGSAWQTMSPGSPYWYGESLARHGFVVLAVDLSHRDDSPLYARASGDDPPHGNGPHPSIVGPLSPNSDFEESGERAWDAIRALDWLLEQPFADPARVLVAGLEAGGETATYVAALDVRVKAAIVAGFAPDLGVRRHNGSHPCGRWAHADERDYIDVSDLQALVAPRAFILETGAAEGPRRGAAGPSDKLVARRARVAWADEPDRYVHYLHDGGAVFRAGVVAPPGRLAGVRTPTSAEPSEASPTAWQSDTRTAPRSPSLYALLDELWR